jgi:hypothetical protein
MGDGGPKSRVDMIRTNFHRGSLLLVCGPQSQQTTFYPTLHPPPKKSIPLFPPPLNLRHNTPVPHGYTARRGGERGRFRGRGQTQLPGLFLPSGRASIVATVAGLCEKR